MDSVIATRTELLARRHRAALAEQGRDLLTDKRTALVRAFGSRSARLLDRLARLQSSAADARAQLDEAVVAVGDGAVSSASFAATGRIGVTLSVDIVAGVVVADVAHDPVPRDAADRGYALAITDPSIDRAADAYEAEVELLLDLAALELSVRRLAEEIARTTRQVNGLEHVVLPRLRSDARRIALVLDAREREETARLKRARAQARRRRAATSTTRTPTTRTPTTRTPTTDDRSTNDRSTKERSAMRSAP